MAINQFPAPTETIKTWNPDMSNGPHQRHKTLLQHKINTDKVHPSLNLLEDTTSGNR
jgi:hypothetical protein